MEENLLALLVVPSQVEILELVKMESVVQTLEKILKENNQEELAKAKVNKVAVKVEILKKEKERETQEI